MSLTDQSGLRVRPICLVVLLAFLAACQESDRTQIAVRDLPVPAGASSQLPHLSKSEDGTVVMSWVEQRHATATLRHARLSDAGWTLPVTVASGDRWFVNWADFPSVVPIRGRIWAAHWLTKSRGGYYAYDVAMATSRDAGATWSSPSTPHQDGTATEHGFVTLFPWNGDVGVVWLDGRRTAEPPSGSAASKGMTLRGARIGPDGDARDGELIDDLVCDCCQTDAAMGPDGPFVVYRNRTTDEIRDIRLARFVDDAWEADISVGEDGWEIAGCPVNGPAIDVVGNSVAVAWYTEAQGRARVRLSRSRDGGAGFGPPIDVSADRPIGRVDVVQSPDGETFVSWLRRGDDDSAELRLSRLAPDGSVAMETVVARTSAARPSGFPQMISDAHSLIFAWTEPGEDDSRIRSARVELTER
ncbi:MAG TPA: sialidase family protein [Pseudomonadales bacterium]|jgi:hypothetical protein